MYQLALLGVKELTIPHLCNLLNRSLKHSYQLINLLEHDRTKNITFTFTVHVSLVICRFLKETQEKILSPKRKMTLQTLTL